MTFLRVEETPTGLAVSGELDVNNAGVLAGRVRAMLLGAHPATLQLDLHRLDFIDVTGVRTLYDLHFDAAAADCALTVSNAPLQTRRIVAVLGFQDVFALSPERRLLAEPGS
ncbi:STAS domain-containing protein [Actinoplanes sp. KI2]|uniref:STAS domain-containing protein n=1 Tax=Actinoplanes sp. KI2 TaxID=2983315 RepID=UPI0021D5FB92|nr:STAS domain-containing protein [Actinoplanes sp. KI2]MCU7725534.1 STAS domain-containing protein [Actinoplanes sp. KI2]